jgi:hypothetical protein
VEPPYLLLIVFSARVFLEDEVHVSPLFEL